MCKSVEIFRVDCVTVTSCFSIYVDTRELWLADVELSLAITHARQTVVRILFFVSYMICLLR